MLGSVQGGTNKCIRQGAEESGQICTSYEQFKLGNSSVAQKVITHMRPLQSVEDYKRQITMVTLSEQGRP